MISCILYYEVKQITQWSNQIFLNKKQIANRFKENLRISVMKHCMLNCKIIAIFTPKIDFIMEITPKKIKLSMRIIEKVTIRRQKLNHFKKNHS